MRVESRIRRRSRFVDSHRSVHSELVMVVRMYEAVTTTSDCGYQETHIYHVFSIDLYLIYDWYNYEQLRNDLTCHGYK